MNSQMEVSDQLHGCVK